MRKQQSFSYHCHTNFSDGKNSIEEMVAKAKAIGFTELGISDHLIVHKNIAKSPSWAAMTKNNEVYIYQRDFKSCLPSFQKHCDDIRKIAKQEKFKVYVGFEVDFFTYNGWLEEFKEFISNLDCDYVISGNHFLFDEKCEIIYNISNDIVDICSNEQIRDLISKHFNNISKSAECGLFKFIAHLDYVRKTGGVFCNPEDFWAEKMHVLDVIAKNNVGLEISTKGLRKIGDYYPCEQIQREAAKRNISVVISDDAHKIEELGYGFADAEDKLFANNLLNRLVF